MRKLLYFQILLLITLSGCGVSSLKDDSTIDTIAPILQVLLYANVDKESKYIFSFESSEMGKIIYEDACGANTQRAKEGINVIEFNQLTDGYYDFCTVTVVDDAGNYSQTLQVPSFTIKGFIVDPNVPSVTPQRVAALDENVTESSGLVYIDGRIFTHNDSGHNAKIYEIDTLGLINRTISVANAQNIDWEDMAEDENYIYIADIGNNSGIRRDLMIYKIAKNDILNKEEVIAQSISITYNDQLDFSSNSKNTPYDAEALISYGNKLYIFTKNWVNQMTYVYSISKEPGIYQLDAITHYTLDYMVTSAESIEEFGSVVLIGYANTVINTSRITLLQDFIEDDFFSGSVTNIILNNRPLGFWQIEALAYTEDGKFYITSETLNHWLAGYHPASLFVLHLAL